MAPKKNPVGRPKKRCNSKTPSALPTKKQSLPIDTVADGAVQVLHPLQDHSHDFVFAADSQAIVPVDEINVVPGRRSRQLKRRDSEEQVLRLIKEQLVPEFGEGVEQKISKDGRWKLVEYMLDVLRGLKKLGKYWTKRNWTDVYTYFPLQVNIQEVLDDPVDATEDVRPELLQALAGPHHRNPALKTSETLERFLEKVG